MALEITGCQRYRLLDRNIVNPNYMTVLSCRTISTRKPNLTRTAPSTSFLDLPAEVRLLIYESIDFPSTSLVLDKPRSLIKKRNHAKPDSRMNMIEPRFPTEILLTCRQIYQEARPILQRKVELVKSQPVRLTFDYSPVWEIIYPACPSESNFGRPDAIKDLCMSIWTCLLRTRRNGNFFPSMTTVELTLTHNRDATYGREIVDAANRLEELMWCGPTRLVLVYKTPLPDIQSRQMSASNESSSIEKEWLRTIPKEGEVDNRTCMRYRLFLRPLEEKAFEQHVKGLRWY